MDRRSLNFWFLVVLLLTTVGLVLTLVPPWGTLTSAFDGVTQVAQRHSVVGYSREAFGHGWGYDSASGCTTRQATVLRQLHHEVGGDRCHPVAWGTCPYSGQPISTDPARHSGAAIEIDHIFPLSAAWDMGAFRWEQEQRVAFANDPANVVAVAAAENQQKSDSLPSEWLPPDRSKRCWYVNQIAEIAAHYRLSLPQSDVAVMHKQCLFR